MYSVITRHSGKEKNYEFFCILVFVFFFSFSTQSFYGFNILEYFFFKFYSVYNTVYIYLLETHIRKETEREFAETKKLRGVRVLACESSLARRVPENIGGDS